MDNTITSWRLNQSTSLTLSIRFGKGEVGMKETYYRSKPPSSVKRDSMRRQIFLDTKRQEISCDHGYESEAIATPVSNMHDNQQYSPESGCDLASTILAGQIHRDHKESAVNLNSNKYHKYKDSRCWISNTNFCKSKSL